MKTAYATLKGFESMRSIKKGQGSAYRIQPGIKGEVRLVEYCFHLGKSALADALEIFTKDFQSEQANLT